MQEPMTIKTMMRAIKNGNANATIIINGRIQRPDKSPDSDGSLGERSNGGFYQLGNGSGNNPGGGGSEPGDEDDGTTTVRAGGRQEDRGREFTLVKSSDIIIQTFSGKNPSNNPYLPFNKSLERLIYNQGADGERLLELLEEAEAYGATKFDNSKLKELIELCPKAIEYIRALMPLLLNYITSIAKVMVEHGVDNGFEAWRRLYHHHYPLQRISGRYPCKSYIL